MYCLAEVLWFIRVLKRICANQHHIQSDTTGPHISILKLRTCMKSEPTKLELLLDTCYAANNLICKKVNKEEEMQKLESKILGQNPRSSFV